MEPGHIGRFEIREPLGRGGMGTVYKAHDPLMDRWVAIKTITVQDAQQRTRFQREAKAAGRLNHPHITTIYDVGEEGALAYIVMELVDGDTLAAQLSAPVPWARAIEFLLPVCRALAYAHGQGVIHRDVKPANILVSRDGRVKLTDFGVARLEMELRRITESGSTVGTPLYTAPEQIRNEAADGRADLFSLGIVLYELITGRHPFAGQTLAQVVYRITGPELADLEPLAALAPPSLVGLVQRALEKDPAARFAGAEEMAAALLGCLDEPWSVPVTPGAAAVAAAGHPASLPRLEMVSNLPLAEDEKALLLRAFAGHDRVYLEREFRQGHSGARVLLVTPMRSGRRLAQIVLKLDAPAAIEREWRAYRTYVADTLPPMTARIQEPPLVAEDGQLALLRYTLAGVLGNVLPESLATYYAGHSGEEVDRLLQTGLFRTFGTKWWLQRSATDFILRREYDRLLPVHLLVEAAALSEETPRSLVAGQVRAHTCRDLKPGQPVQLQSFTVEEVRAGRGEMTLWALPPSGHQANPVRVRVVGLGPEQLDYGFHAPGNADHRQAVAPARRRGARGGAVDGSAAPARSVAAAAPGRAAQALAGAGRHPPDGQGVPLQPGELGRVLPGAGHHPVGNAQIQGAGR